MSAGSPICRASVSASRASGTALGVSPAEYVTVRDEGELEGGVGEVATGPGDGGGLFGKAVGVGERAGRNRDDSAGVADDFLDPPVVEIAAFVGLGGAAAQFLGDVHIPAIGGEHGADR